jgi:hypothetical protein
VKGIFEAKNFVLTSAEFPDKKTEEFEFTKAAEMFVLFEAANNLY